MDIKLKHFYYNETENAMVFVKQVETIQDEVDVVKISKKDILEMIKNGEK